MICINICYLFAEQNLIIIHINNKKMNTRKIKTIDVEAKEWFDKINGNSYFAGLITINYGRKDAVQLKMPFQYGYGDSYRYKAFEAIRKQLNCFKNIDNNMVYWRAYEKYNITTRHSLKENCLKRELINL